MRKVNQGNHLYIRVSETTHLPILQSAVWRMHKPTVGIWIDITNAALQCCRVTTTTTTTTSSTTTTTTTP